MTSRSCTKCGKTFQYPSRLKRHQSGRPCIPILESGSLPEEEQKKAHRCHFCGHRFTTIKAMRYHIRKTCKIAPNDKNGNAGMEILYEHVKKEQERNTRLEEKLEKMEEQMGQLVTLLTKREGEGGTIGGVQGNKNVVDQSVNKTTNNNITIINTFGKEAVDHIGPAEIRVILESASRLQDPASQALLAVLTQIYNNPDHPENYTCYHPNKKDKLTLVHGPAGWRTETTTTTYPPMIKRSLDVLFDMKNQPRESTPEWADLHPPDKFERVYKTLDKSEQDYPQTLKPELLALTLQLRTNIQKESGGKLPHAGDE